MVTGRLPLGGRAGARAEWADAEDQKIAAAAIRAFGPAGTAVGAMTGAFGRLQMVFGGTGIGPLSPVDLVLVGLSIFAVCGAIVVIRHEWLLREVDNHLGNEHRRALWSDGTPATWESYLQYARDGDYATNMTPLIAAIARRCWDIAEQLLRSGADAHKIDTAGATLMDYALAYEAPTELIDNLSRRGIKPAQPSLRLASSGHGSYGHISIKWEKSESPDGEN
jgi:hypothetical protein